MTTEIDINEKPILFSGEMVRAILEGKKTQTRRVLKRQPYQKENGDLYWRVHSNHEIHIDDFFATQNAMPGLWCPYGMPGDQLWVRETWLMLDHYHWAEPDKPDYMMVNTYKQPFRNGFSYRASTDEEGDEIRKEYGYKWKPSIHMPRRVSRLQLLIKDIRVEQLCDITELEAYYEGIDPTPCLRCDESGICPSENNPCEDCDGKGDHDSRDNFRELWNQLNEKRGFGWDVNPWVWVVEFEKIDT